MSCYWQHRWTYGCSNPNIKSSFPEFSLSLAHLAGVCTVFLTSMWSEGDSSKWTFCHHQTHVTFLFPWNAKDFLKTGSRFYMQWKHIVTSQTKRRRRKNVKSLVQLVLSITNLNGNFVWHTHTLFLLLYYINIIITFTNIVKLPCCHAILVTSHRGWNIHDFDLAGKSFQIFIV